VLHVLELLKNDIILISSCSMYPPLECRMFQGVDDKRFVCVHECSEWRHDLR